MRWATLIVVSVATALNVGLWFWSRPGSFIIQRQQRFERQRQFPCHRSSQPPAQGYGAMSASLAAVAAAAAALCGAVCVCSAISLRWRRWLRPDSQALQQCLIMLDFRIAGGEQPLAVEDGIGTRQKRQRLHFIAHLRPTG
jgi:hypothetical protein